MNEAKIKDSAVKMSVAETLTIIKRAVSVSLKTKTAFTMTILFLGFIAALIPALISYLMKSFTNEIQSMATGGEYSMQFVLLLFFSIMLLHIIQVVFNFLSSYSRSCDSIRTNRFLIEHIVDRTCRVKYEQIENNAEFAQKIQFINSYAGSRVASSIQSILSWLQLLVTFVSVFVMISAVNVWIALILLLTSIPAAILSYKQRDETYVHNVKYMMEGALVIHYMQILTRHNPHNDICHFRIYDYLKMKWREICDDYTQKKNRMSAKHVLYNGMADLVRNGVYVGVLIFSAYMIYKDPYLGLGTFTLMTSLSKSFQSVTSNLLIRGGLFLSDVHYMKDFFSLDDMELEEIDRDASAYDSGDVKFENVYFTYPGGKEPVLKNINVTIKDGETVAIVGENGSGKTTFVNLLCSMYYADRGCVYIGGREIRENLSSSRRSVSAVFQNFGKYDATIRHNITVSDPTRIEEDEDGALMRLCRLTGFASCVEEQPNGLDEEIGDFAQKGNDLSGGQWQKLAITRALWRNKARIMVLDEPTAALDPIAEAEIYSNFTQLTGGRTTIMVSHRLGITSIVDRILVFQDGEIVEDGSHRELLERGGYYSELYNAQAKWYGEELGT